MAEQAMAEQQITEPAQTADGAQTAEPAGPGRRRPWWARRRTAIAALLVIGVVAAGVAIADRGDTPTNEAAAGSRASAPDPLAVEIGSLQDQLRLTPNNADSWARLGLDYVQQAKNTANPMYYPKAEGTLAKSLSINNVDNYAGLAGMGALRSAQHRFAEALALAQQARAIAPSNSTIYGTLADAYTQLGRYDEAADAVQHMLDLHPGTPAFTRAEYVYELRGQVDQARDVLNQGLAAASSPADQAFCRYYLGELAFTNGDPAESLRQNELGLAADPTSPDLLQGKARAEAALGQVDVAVGDYARVVAAAPLPQYVIEAGEYLESIGRTAQAQQDYQLFDVENSLFTSNGVQLDTDPTLFYADHGDPAKALQFGKAGIAIRPFLEMDDAYAWALHANHRDAEALTLATKAQATGMRNALFSFHKGMIEFALGKKDAARADLSQALAINPHFSARHVPTAQATLAQLGGPQ